MKKRKPKAKPKPRKSRSAAVNEILAAVKLDTLIDVTYRLEKQVDRIVDAFQTILTSLKDKQPIQQPDATVPPPPQPRPPFMGVRRDPTR